MQATPDLSLPSPVTAPIDAAQQASSQVFDIAATAPPSRLAH